MKVEDYYLKRKLSDVSFHIVRYYDIILEKGLTIFLSHFAPFFEVVNFLRQLGQLEKQNKNLSILLSTACINA